MPTDAIGSVSSGVAMGVWGQMSPLLFQDGAQDVFKIDERIFGGR